jgi:hypothetical protein
MNKTEERGIMVKLDHDAYIMPPLQHMPSILIMTRE